jgi:cytochrome c peroxidase
MPSASMKTWGCCRDPRGRRAATGFIRSRKSPTLNLSRRPSNLGFPESRGTPGKLADAGKFRKPSLRNVALTAPYMRDGSVVTLDEVLDHYASGGRTISGGPCAGHGHDNPYRDARITGIALTPQNRQDLLAFLAA